MKCPSCVDTISSLKTRTTNRSDGGDAVVYCRSHCGAILSVAPDVRKAIDATLQPIKQLIHGNKGR